MESRTPAWLETLKKVRGIEWIVLLIVLGVALALIAPSLTPQSSPETQRSPPLSVSIGSDEELRLGRVLSSVEGAGEVEVFLTYAEDSGKSSTAKPSQSVKGVIVVAEGAGDVALRIRLTDAVRAALDIPVSRIEVLPMKASPTQAQQMRGE